MVNINKLDLDAILLYGMGLLIPFKYARLVINKAYSKQFIEETFKEFIKQFGYRLAINVASNTGIRTYIAQPFPSNHKLQKQKFSSELYARKLEEISFFQERFLNELNLNYYLQPIETFDPNCTTFAEYTIGSKLLSLRNSRDNRYHPPNERMHMNDMFGEIFIKSFLKELLKGRGFK